MNFIDEQIARLKKQQSDPNYVAPNLPKIIPQDDNTFTDSGNWLEAAGIGASNMVNNLALGGFAQLLGTPGRGVEWISPFSGSKDNDRARLESWGVSPDIAREAYPDEDSWFTSSAKGLLEAQNFIGDKINQWREQSIGDNPSFGTQVAEGVGSSLGFMGAGLLSALASGSPYAGAIISGLTEAMSESGGVLGDAYRQGLYDDRGLAAANKSLAANAALNGVLNTTLGMFSPWTKNIRNPLTRYAAQSGTEVLNEILQEPSQQTIEKAAHDSLHNGGNFMPALGVHVKDWPQDFSKLLPSVAASSLITSLVKGGIDMSSAQNRQLVRDEWRNRMYDPEETAASLRAELDKRQKLLNQLQRTKALTPDNAKSIDDINNQIRNADKNIATYQDRLKPGYLDYIPNPYDEFSGRVSKVTTRAGQNEYNTAFMLAEADDLITSHNDTFSPNPDYNQDWQIRDRSNISSQNEVKRIADNLDPSSLGDNRHAQNGAPIVFQNEDGKNYVISGNGRTLAIRQAYKYNNEGAKNYRKFIIDNAANFGVDPNIAASMKKPVLVRSLLDKNIDLAQFAADANSNTTQQLNATEKSLDYAKKINEKNLMRHFDPDKNISDNSDFLRELYKLTDPAERNNLTYTQGNTQTFSRQFVDDVANALRAVAFGDTHEHILVGKLNQATDDVSRNISNALNKLAPSFAVLNSSGHSDYNIAQELEDAVINLDRYRNNATQDITVEGQDRTLNMFDDLNLTPEARTILDFFLKYGNKPTEILQGLANYAKLASEQTEDGQGTIDGFATKSDKLTLLNRAFGNTSTRQLQQNTQQVTPQKITAPVQQTAQQSNPAQNIQPTAAQTTQNTPNVTAMNNQQQPQTQAQIQQDNINNPQGSRLVHNRQANSYDEEIQQSKSAPDYSESTDTGDLRLYPQQHNARGYTPFDTIGLKHNQFQELNDSDVPQYADISGLTQNTDNQQATQKPQNNSPNLNDYQGLGNLGSNIGNRSQVTNQRQQSQISSEQGNEDNSQLGVPQYVDISALIDTEQNNDENTQPYDNVNRSNFDHQYDSNSQQNLQTLSNNVQDNANVQNQQEQAKSDDYLPPEIIKTKEGNIKVEGAKVQRSFIPSEHAQIQNAVKKGKTMLRVIFAKHGEKDSSAPTANNPEKYSYDAKLTGYDGYLGDVTTGAGNYTDTAHAFYGLENGVHYVGFADDNGNFVATYNMNDNSFFINEGSETSGLARKIEAEFKRQFGHNPTAEIIRRLVMQKAINAGENDSVADAASRIYMAENEYLAAQTGISLLDMAMADNLSIQKFNKTGENGDRGSTKIIPEMGIDGNPVFEAQNVVSLFKNSDASSLIHEFWHIYQEKIKRLGNAGLINEGTNLFDDWKTIRSDAGLLRANFKEGLSPQEYAKWLNSQEKNAASFEKYFREGKPPEGISQKMLAVFNNFKDWLTNIYRKVRDIFYTNANGRRINNFAISDDIRNVFDHILLPHRKVNFNQATEQGQKLNSSSDPQGFQEFRQSGLDPQGWFSKRWDKIKHWAGNLFSSAAKAGLPKSPTDWRSLPFPTQETQQRFMDAMKAAPKLGIIGRMRLTVRDIAASIKGGDYSDITNSTRKNDPQLRLNEALQAFRNLGRSKVAAADKAVTLMTNIIRPLNKKQRELLNTYTVIRDIAEQIDEMPGSPLSFGLSEQDARKMNAQLARMVDEDEKVKDAVKQLDDTRNAQVEEFKKQAHALGLNFDDVFHYKNYFRRRVFQYLEASRAGKHIPSARGNLDIQGRYDGELREIMGHSFFMKRKGTQLDYVTDYVQANAEVRAQLAQDIETMKTLQIIKKNHDIASDLRKQHGLKSQQLEIDYDGSQSFSQSGEEHKSLLDVIPDGYEAFDPSATRLIETANSSQDNLMHMVANDIAEQHGFPLDTLLERLGIQNEGNLMV
ncbi:MAG: hypothetical protein IJQ08_09435, partial [Synergistaceae bacterium]|nr:hypothetical protein [Synergistaceae bacterium]